MSRVKPDRACLEIPGHAPFGSHAGSTFVSKIAMIGKGNVLNACTYICVSIFQNVEIVASRVREGCGHFGSNRGAPCPNAHVFLLVWLEQGHSLFGYLNFCMNAQIVIFSPSQMALGGWTLMNRGGVLFRRCTRDEIRSCEQGGLRVRTPHSSQQPESNSVHEWQL